MIKMWRLVLVLALNSWIAAQEAAAGNETLLAVPFLFQYYPRENCSHLYPAQDASKYEFFYTSQLKTQPTSVVAYTVHIPEQETVGVCKRHPQVTYRFQIADYAEQRTFQSEDELCITLYSLCYQCKNKVRALTVHFKDNPTLSMIAHLFGSHFNHSLAIYPMPYSTQDSSGYTYKVLFGAQRHGLLDGVVFHVMYSGTNVTVHMGAGDAVGLRNNKHYQFYRAGQTIHLTEQCRNDILWIEPNVSDCDQPTRRHLQEMRIESSHPIKVFTNQAYCNHSGGFSHQTQLVHELPSPDRWGKSFVIDVQQVQTLPASIRRTLKYELSILSSQTNNSIDVTYYSKTEGDQAPGSTEQYNGSVVIEKWNHFIEGLTHISIQAMHPVLVIYSVHNSRSNHERVIYYSVLAQPVSWFANIQRIALSGANSSLSNYRYHVSVTIPKSKYTPQSIFISTPDSFHNGTALNTYEGFNHKIYTSGDYILLYLTLLDVSSDSLLLWHQDPAVDIGTTVFAYSTERHYAYSSGYIQAGSPRDLSRQRTAAHSAPAESKVPVVVVPILFLLMAALLVGVVCYYRRRDTKTMFRVRDDEQLLISEEPGTDFEYDLFILFSDEDEQLVRTCLYTPLRNKSYKVLWKHDPSHSLFEPGADIVSDLSMAAQVSRKILVVCTKNLCEREAFERDMSFFKDVQKSEQKRRLIPLVLEKEFHSHQFKDYNQIRVRHRQDLLNDSTVAREAIQKLVRSIGEPLGRSTMESLL